MSVRALIAILLVLVVGAAVPAQASGPTVVHRDLDDAFLDDFNYTGGPGFGPPIRAQMPFNAADADRDLIAAIRVDNFDAITAAGPYSSFEELLQAFYLNQQAFNEDPERNQIRMTGTIREVREPDGTILAIVDITYHDLPLTVYTYSSWNTAFDKLNLTALEPVLVDGTFSGHFHVTLVLPYPGAPLEFWNLEQREDFRFVGNGEGLLVDANGEPTQRARVHVHQTCDRVLGCEAGRSEVRLTATA